MIQKERPPCNDCSRSLRAIKAWKLIAKLYSSCIQTHSKVSNLQLDSIPTEPPDNTTAMVIIQTYLTMFLLVFFNQPLPNVEASPVIQGAVHPPELFPNNASKDISFPGNGSSEVASPYYYILRFKPILTRNRNQWLRKKLSLRLQLARISQTSFGLTRRPKIRERCKAASIT